MRVELGDIHKYFGPVQANAGISLAFEPGRIYALLGENGAGKRTLMKILSGYQAPTRGTIRLNDQPIIFQSPIDALTCGIGMMYQDPADFPPLHVVENHLLAYDEKLLLRFGLAEETLHSYAQRFGFTVDPKEYVDSLTLGERQQLELLRLLALGAEVLILDEPTTGISAEQKEILFNTLRRLAHEENKTVILVSHKLEEVQELCDEVAVLRRGKLIGTCSMPTPTAELVRMMFGTELPSVERPSLTFTETVLQVLNASFRSDRLTVNNVNLELRKGEVLGLAGLEGSGQRELLQVCAGLIPMMAGEIVSDEAPLRGRKSPFIKARGLILLPLIMLAVPLAFSFSPLSQINLNVVATAVQSVLSLLLLATILWIADIRRWRRQKAYILVATLVTCVLAYAALGNPVLAALTDRPPVGILLFLTGVMWLLVEILIVWTSGSPYHEFRRRGGAYVPAGRLEEGLVPGLSLTEHMALSSLHQGFMVDWQQARQEMEARIKRFNIIGQPETTVDALSGGNQQRSMLALLRSPLKLMLLEHPTRGLDATSANWIWEMFQARRENGTAIVFMSADIDELVERSDRIVFFSGGVMSSPVSARDTTVDELGHLVGGKHES